MMPAQQSSLKAAVAASPRPSQLTSANLESLMAQPFNSQSSDPTNQKSTKLKNGHKPLTANFGTGDHERSSVMKFVVDADLPVDSDSHSGASVASSRRSRRSIGRQDSEGSDRSNVSCKSYVSNVSYGQKKTGSVPMQAVVDVTPIVKRSGSTREARSERGSIKSVYSARNSLTGIGRKTVVFEDPVPAAETVQAKMTVRRLSNARHAVLLQNGNEGRVKTEESILNFPLFESSPHAFAKELAKLAKPRVFAEGDVILKRGCPGHCLYIVHTGTIGVTLLTEEDVTVLSRGDYWGESNILGLNSKWDATLTAKETVHAAELHREDLQSLLYQWPDEHQRYEELLEASKLAMDHGTLSHTCELLQGFSNSTLVGIDNATVRRFYFPGQTLLEQGQTGDSMVILVRGQCEVLVDGNTVRQESRSCGMSFDKPAGEGETSVLKSRKGTVFSPPSSAAADLKLFGLSGGRVSPAAYKSERSSVHSGSADSDGGVVGEADEPVCFGELCLLGIQQQRSASIVASSICQVRLIFRSAFMRVLEDYRESLNMSRLSEFLKKRYDGAAGLSPGTPALQTLKEVAIFKEVGCSEPFLEFLSQHLEDRIFLGGQRIIEENVPDDHCMYILGQGKAKVLKGGQQVGTITDGAVFGEVVLLGLESKRQATIIAEDACYAQILHQHYVVNAMQLFPDERQKLLMIAFKREPTSKDGPAAIKCYKPDGTPDWKANNLQSVIMAVQKNSMFGDVGADFIEHLSMAADDRIFMPGELILQEGATGDSLFIVVSGQAQVYINQDTVTRTNGGSLLAAQSDEEQKVMTTKIGMLTAGSISGELAMLGIAKTRSATVEAETICVLWEITHEKAMPIIDAHPSSRVQFLESVCKHLEHTVSNCIDNIDLFSRFDRKFRMLLGLYCDRHAYFPGQTIFQEGIMGEGLCILNLGQGRLTRKNIPIKMVSPGSHFNSTTMLGSHKVCFCSLTAVATCHVVVISRCSYVQALEQYPSDHVAKELAKQEQASMEEFREAVRRLCTRGAILNKSQAVISNAFINTGATEKATDAQVLKKFFKQWWQHTVTTTNIRREKHTRKQFTDTWIQKQREAVAHRQRSLQGKASAEPAKPSSSRGSTVLPDVVDRAQSPSPQTKVGKYNKLSSVYLGSRQEWHTMIYTPRSPRQRQVWGLQGSTETKLGSSQYSAPKTPRVGPAGRQMGQTCNVLWPGGNRTDHLSWDAAEALGW